MKLIKRNNMAGIPSIFDDFFKDDFFRFPAVEREWGGTVPSVNIRETEESFELEVAAPGLKKGDFQLNLDHDVLTISSEKKDAQEVKEGNWKKREFSYATFKRSFHLPETVDVDQIGARYEDGILHISLPKREEAKVKPVRMIEVA